MAVDKTNEVIELKAKLYDFIVLKGGLEDIIKEKDEFIQKILNIVCRESDDLPEQITYETFLEIIQEKMDDLDRYDAILNTDVKDDSMAIEPEENYVNQDEPVEAEWEPIPAEHAVSDGDLQ